MSTRRKTSKSSRTPGHPRRRQRAVPRRMKATAAPGPAGSGLAPGMQAINTYLAVANVAASMDFLERAFGFARGVVLGGPDERPRYAEMRHGDSVVILVHKGDPATATGGAAALYTYVPDVDRAAAQAREAGAGVEQPDERPWGDRAVVITDPDGYRWVLATFKKLAAFG